jgi:hypothetical protein
MTISKKLGKRSSGHMKSIHISCMPMITDLFYFPGRLRKLLCLQPASHPHDCGKKAFITADSLKQKLVSMFSCAVSRESVELSQSDLHNQI